MKRVMSDLGARASGLGVVVLACAVACSSNASTGAPAAPRKPATLAERILALLPDGAQVLVEIDLARLRANAVVGDVAMRAISELSAQSPIPGIPPATDGSPLAQADFLILAAYGVGTAQAATVSVLATRQDIPTATRLAPDLLALGPPDWMRQVEARAAIAARSPLAASLQLMSLRDHAVPDKAPGTVLRVTARLPFDARVALARQLGVDTTPAQLSIWGDVVDDMAIIIDADATDPGERKTKAAASRLARTLTALLTEIAREPAIRALGLSASLNEARVVVQGTWVRVIIAVGPRLLARVVDRVRIYLKH